MQHARPITLHEALYVVALMWDPSHYTPCIYDVALVISNEWDFVVSKVNHFSE